MSVSSESTQTPVRTKVATWSELSDRTPAYALGGNIDLATQKEHLRARLVIERSAERLDSFLKATVELMQILARACGHTHLQGFELRDLTTWKRDIAELTGVRYAGVAP